MGLKEEDSLVQENIQEFIHDDNKIVTCKWLSLTLSIPVNSAKLALYQFVDSARQTGNNDDINVTYFLSGFETKDCGTKILKCVVVPEPHLDSMKQTLDPLTSCHVYSVHKAKLKDYTPLYQADYDICKENVESLHKLSPISCPWAVLREDRPVSGQDAKDSSLQKTGSKGSETPNPSSASTTTPASDTGRDKKAPANKKGGIASMFANAAKKEKTSSEKNTVSTKDDSTTSSSKSKNSGGDKKGIQSMFKAQAAKKSEVKDVKKEKESSPKSESNTKQKTKSKPAKSQKHKLSGGDEPQTRKRRRIRNDLFDSSDEEKDKDDDDDDEDDVDVEMSDHEGGPAAPPSEDEKDDADDKEEEMKAKEEEEEREKKTSRDAEKKGDNMSVVVNKDGKRRKRTRKLVPKQHIDEDGFMVTEKVWESDSTDASDQEQETKTDTTHTKASSPPSKANTKQASKTAPAASKKKAAAVVSPSKNKQTSLMSFFKKK